MLQRIQTVFLIITAIAMGLFIAFPLWVNVLNDQIITLDSFQIAQSKDGAIVGNKKVFYIAAMAAISIVVGIISIFQYKNRVRQMMMVAFNSLLMAAAIGVAVYHIKYDAMEMGEFLSEGQFGIGIYAGFVALLSNWIANRFIRKDEKLVRNADRMR